ncbi:MAG: L,D-transpeptidase [Aestuariivirga sp.]|nr:L,D-transpeptidase [Aestuariivirga sp.]
MPITRRALLTSALFAGLAPVSRALAQSGEPFPVPESEAKKVAYKFQRREMAFKTPEPAGTIVVDTKRCFLYHVSGGGQAMRYGVSVGKSSKAWKGEAVIKRMAKWPVWVPAPYHLEEIPSLAKHINGMPGGPDNPMGARALYLYQGEVDTINRIHGSAKPSEIGSKKTAGCFGMLNIDIIHLYDRVAIGTRVVVLG